MGRTESDKNSEKESSTKKHDDAILKLEDSLKNLPCTKWHYVIREILFISCIIVVLVISALFFCGNNLSSKNNAVVDKDTITVTQSSSPIQTIVIQQKDGNIEYKVLSEELPIYDKEITKIDHTSEMLFYISFMIIVITTLTGLFVLLFKTLLQEKEANAKFRDKQWELLKELYMWKLTDIKKKKELEEYKKKELELRQQEFESIEKVKLEMKYNHEQEIKNKENLKVSESKNVNSIYLS
ncbi:MAG: hypothetical protein IJ328_08295 [Muribaculaceae bacterium]|nr:hypothetical protein [Muribaculaceae bacterium]